MRDKELCANEEGIAGRDRQTDGQTDRQTRIQTRTHTHAARVRTHTHTRTHARTRATRTDSHFPFVKKKMKAGCYCNMYFMINKVVDQRLRNE